MRAGFTKKIQLIVGVVPINKFFSSRAAQLTLPNHSRLIFASNPLGFFSLTDST